MSGDWQREELSVVPKRPGKDLLRNVPIPSAEKLADRIHRCRTILVKNIDLKNCSSCSEVKKFYSFSYEHIFLGFKKIQVIQIRLLHLQLQKESLFLLLLSIYWWRFCNFFFLYFSLFSIFTIFSLLIKNISPKMSSQHLISESGPV
jgi:hypothetical protein